MKQEKTQKTFTQRVIISLDCEITKAAYDDLQMSIDAADQMIQDIQQANYRYFKGIYSADEVLMKLHDAIRNYGFQSKRFYAQIENRLKKADNLPCEIEAFQYILSN